MSKKPRIVSLGEVLWDVFPDGPRFGGAPANVACHAAALGADAAMLSAVGDDDLGTLALGELKERRVDTECVGVTEKHPTGIVQVDLDASGKPSFAIGENVAWDHLAWSDQAETLAKQTEAVCFGTLGQRSKESRDTIRKFVETVPTTALRILDVNLRPPFFDDTVILESLELANELKLSDEELGIVAKAVGITGDESEMLSALGNRFDLQLIALTRGDEGATLIRGSERSDVEGASVVVQDTVGAGDAFTAALMLGILANKPLNEINQHAGEVAAYVCSQSGATPELPEHLR